MSFETKASAMFLTVTTAAMLAISGCVNLAVAEAVMRDVLCFTANCLR